MTIIDRYRVAQLIELSVAERALEGTERLVREPDVALLIKAAFDDASDAARAAFMTQVKPLPVINWPWSAVRSGMPRAEAGANYKFEPNLLGKAPPPQAPLSPPALTLIMGQAPTTEVAPGNEIPDRNSAAGKAWEPLYQALTAWNTTVVNTWIGPQGWMDPSGIATGQSDPVDPAAGPPSDGGGVVDVPKVAMAWPAWAPMAAAAAGVVVATTVVVVMSRGSDRRLESKLGVGR